MSDEEDVYRRLEYSSKRTEFDVEDYVSGRRLEYSSNRAELDVLLDYIKKFLEKYSNLSRHVKSVIAYDKLKILAENAIDKIPKRDDIIKQDTIYLSTLLSSRYATIIDLSTEISR